MNGDLAPFVGCLPRCYRARVSAVSLCSVSYKISGAEPHALNDLSTVESILLDAARETGLTVVSSTHHRFKPQGLSAVVILSESPYRRPHLARVRHRLRDAHQLSHADSCADRGGGEMVRRRLQALHVISSEVTL